MDPNSHPSPEALEAVSLGIAAPEDVQKHLASCAECAQLLADMRANNEFMVDLRAAEKPGAVGAVPQTVPGYKLLEPLSKGGQGIVYRAVQVNTGRVVAVKMMLGGWFATEQQRRRFEHEIDIASHMKHPNITVVFDAIEVKSGIHAFAMEFIDGRPLDVWEPATGSVRGHSSPDSPTLDPDSVTAAIVTPRGTAGTAVPPGQQALPRAGAPRSRTLARETLRAKLEMFAKVCDAVHYAHTRGIIHRDLKPSNILADAAGEPHILDFGIAIVKNTDLDPGKPYRLTGVTGTIEFASPEQALGDPSQLDFTTDVYSLGVILYAMLTARLPYTLTGTTRQRLDTIARTPPIRPSLVDPMLKGDLEAVLLKALEKDKAKRYQIAGELGREIRNLLAGEPVAARGGSLAYVIGKKARKHKWRVIATAAALALVAGGIGTALVQREARLVETANRERAESVAAKEKTEKEQARAEAAEQRAAAVEAQREGELLLQRVFTRTIKEAGDESSATGRAKLAAAAQNAGRGLLSDPNLADLPKAKLLKQLAEEFGEFGFTGPQRFYLLQARDFARAAGATGTELVQEVNKQLDALPSVERFGAAIARPENYTPEETLSLAREAYRAREYEPAVALARRAERMFGARGATEACNAAEAANIAVRAALDGGVGVLAQVQGLSEAAKKCESAITRARIGATVGACLIDADKVEEAWIAVIGAAGDAARTGVPAAVLASSVAKMDLKALQAMKAEARAAACEGALRVLQEVTDGEEAAALRAATTLGLRLCSARAFGAAEQILAVVVARYEQGGEQSRDRLVNTLWELGRAQGAGGNIKDAAATLERAKAIDPESVSGYYADTDRRGVYLAVTRAAGDAAATVAAAREALRAAERQYSRDSFQASAARTQLADALIADGQLTEAETALLDTDRALRAAIDADGEPTDVLQLALMRAVLAKLRLTQGKAEEALGIVRDSMRVVKEQNYGDPGQRMHMLELGCLVTLGKLDEADALFHAVLPALSPSERAAERNNPAMARWRDALDAAPKP
ncbi:MAG: serine/threonine protein kinase [Planctomycetes bacterium]|nr:serine/threonine protein kinase [Planctomycetota bacterium]